MGGRSGSDDDLEGTPLFWSIDKGTCQTEREGRKKCGSSSGDVQMGKSHSQQQSGPVNQSEERESNQLERGGEPDETLVDD